MSERRIVRVEFDGALCRTYSEVGERVAEFPTVHEPVYNGQYDVPLSHDGSRLYVPTWRQGLFCYDTATGHLVWKQGPGKVRQVEVVGDVLVIEMADRGIYVRDGSSGRLLREERLSGMEAFFRMGKDQLFAGPKRNRYFVFHLPDLKITHTIPAATLNPDECLSFIIRGVQASGEALTISGWERYSDRLYNPREEPQGFVRRIPLEEFAASSGA